jgi:hypothetical protein
LNVGMKSFWPLDGRKWRAINYLRVPQNNSRISTACNLSEVVSNNSGLAEVMLPMLCVYRLS